MKTSRGNEPPVAPTMQSSQATATATATDDVVRRLGGRRAVFAAVLPNAIEFYDFYAFGLLAPVLAKVFFPSGDGVASLLYVFTLFAVAFGARPIGAALFGHFGDRYGRRNVLVMGVLLMLFATALIGLAPTYASVGILAPIWLTVARLLQGVSTGGQIGGLLTYLVEVAPSHRRGRYGAVLNVASGLGSLAGVLSGKLIALFDPDQLASWGFRLPFLVSIPFGLTVLLLRWSAPESPEFVKQSTAPAKLPLVTIFREHTGKLLLVIGVIMAQVVGGFGLLIYLPTYLQTSAHVSASTAYNYGILLSALWILLVVPMGALSDRFGRRPVLMAGAGLLAVGVFPAFHMLASGNAILGVLGCVMLMVTLTAAVGPTSAIFAEQFPTSVRYTACGLGFALASSLFGGTAPLLGTYVTSSLKMPWLFILYVAVAGLVTFVVAATAVRETAHGGLSTTVDQPY
jgi:MFS transporter, MHS family, proline/betaine transporter